MKVDSEVVLHPIIYEGAVFEMISGTDNLAFRQNPIHGSAPTVQFYPSAKACTFHGDCEIPNMYSKASVDLLIADIYNDMYINTGTDTLLPNIGLSNYYTKSYAYVIDNELSTLVVNTYTTPKPIQFYIRITPAYHLLCVIVIQTMKLT